MSKVDKKAARASLKALKDVREGKVNRLEQLEVNVRRKMVYKGRC